MSAHDEHDDGEQHDEDEDDNEQQGEGEEEEADSSFKDEAEAAPVTITEWVELDEDEEDDEEFDPEAAAEEEEEEDDEEEEEVEIDEDEQAELEEEALAGQEANAELDEGEGDEEEEEEDAGEDDDEEGEEGDSSGAAIGQLFRGVMKVDGPTVTTVLLKADGTKEELVSAASNDTAPHRPSCSLFHTPVPHSTHISPDLCRCVLCAVCVAQSLDMTPRIDSRQPTTAQPTIQDTTHSGACLLHPIAHYWLHSFPLSVVLLCHVLLVQLLVCCRARRASLANMRRSKSSY